MTLPKTDIYVALIHHPVMNKKNQTIGSALTTIDLHDIARACATYGVKAFYVITPYRDQADLARQVIEHWTNGVGGRLNPHRKQALERIRVTRTIEEAALEINKETDVPVICVATSAKQGRRPTVTAKELKERLNDTVSPMLIFGTAWGLTEDLIDSCDYVLEPIKGDGPYNHLSVRSAVSIYLDRIINDR